MKNAKVIQITMKVEIYSIITEDVYNIYMQTPIFATRSEKQAGEIKGREK